MAERIEGLSIGLGLDSTGLTQGLKAAKTSIKQVSSEMAASMSAFDRGEKSVGKYQTQLTGLNKKLNAQKTAVSAARTEYDRMVATHGESSTQAQRAATAYNREVAAVNNLERHVETLTDEFRAFERQQEAANSTMGRLSTTMTNAGASMTKIGDGMKKVGKNMSMYVTAPIAGVGLAAAKLGVDFDDSMAKVQAVSGATGGELEQLREKAKEMGSTTKFSASEAADGLNYMALAGWSTEEMLSGLDGVMSLAAASGEDLGSVSDIVTDSLSAFGLEAKDSGRFADVLASASSNANTDVMGLGAAFQYVAPVAGALGFTVEDTATAIGLMSNAGIKGEKSGTALRTMMTNLAKPTSAMKTEMENLGISLTNTDGTMKTFDEIMNELRTSFSGLDEAQQASAAATIFGKEAMSGALAVINTSEEDYDSLAGSIKESDGAAESMAETMEGTLGGVLREIKSGVEGFAISIYEEMKPALTEGAETIKGMVGWLNDLPAGTKKSIVGFAAVAAAIGPVLVVGGTLISSLGAIFTAVGTVTGAVSVMTAGAVAATPAVAGLATVFTVLTGPVGLAIAGIAALTVGGVALGKYLSGDALEEVDVFGSGIEGVSDSTTKALDSFWELGEGVDEALMDMRISGDVLTQEYADTIVGNFEEMNNQILGKMNEGYEEQKKVMLESFEGTRYLTDEERNKILKKMDTHHTIEKEKQQAQMDRIYEIEEAALSEQRELTEGELIEINAIQTQMQDAAVEHLSESAAEEAAIRQRIADTAGDITLNQAADLIGKAAKVRDETVQAAEDEYDDKIAVYTNMKDNLGTLTDEQYKTLVNKAKDQRDDTVAESEGMYDDIYSETMASNKELNGLIDKDTGETLSKWEVYKNGVVDRFKEKKEKTIDEITSMGKSIKDGAEEVKNTALEKWTTFKNGVVTKFTEMKDDAKDRFDDLVQAGKDLPGRIGDGIKSMASKVSDGVKAVSNKLASGLGAGVNGVISGINWVLGKIGIFSSGHIPKWTVPEYASGTKGHHPGGLMVVGDGKGSNAGPELIETPDGKQALSPTKSTLTAAPAGTKVWSATETRKIMDMVPHYAFGDKLRSAGEWVADKYNSGKEKVKSIGSKVKDVAVNAFDYIKSPGKFLDLALKTLGIEKPKGGSFVGNMAKGGYNKVKDGAVDFVKEKLAGFTAAQSGISLTGGSGGGFGSPFRFTSGPGPRNTGIAGASTYHKGWDWAAPIGTPIPSVTDGVGHRTGFHPLSGNFVEVKAPDGKVHRYQHNSRNLLAVGQNVRKGQTVGLVGNTGVGSGAHLHYEVKGFADGGVVKKEQLAMVGEGNKEEIIIPVGDKSKRTNAMKLLALAGKKLAGGSNASPPQLQNAGGDDLVNLMKQMLSVMQNMPKGDTYITIPAKDLKEFKDVTDFFNKLPQTVNQY